VDQIIRASRNLLGDTDLVVTVPPMHRMRIEHEQAVQEVDETLAAWTPTLLQRGTLLQKTARAWMPLALRGAPRGWEIKRIPLLGPDGQLITLDLSAPRTAVYLAPCGKRAARVAQRLQQLVEDHAVTGLRGVTILPRVCPGQTPRPPHTLGGSAEVLWALQAHPADLVVLDRTGAVMHRAADLDDAVAYLERSWPPFAAVRQVSVRPATSVRDAAAQRLYTRASREFRARRYAEAHGLLDQTIALDPEHAEAHRERALLKARLGDISGAMREVTWWRSSFGEESAEDLLDEIQRVTAAR
jgi:hypothetical protein